MRKMKYSGLQRLIAMILALVLTVGLLPRISIPVAADASGAMLNVNEKLADPSTMDDWVNYFGPDKLSTEFVGGVWTDKTVLTDDDQFEHVSLSNPNNFMVALTAIASNKEVEGHTSASSDTMLVLDVSQSMDQISAVPTMVEAANASIAKLQGMNKNNRIGVVLFSGSDSQGNSTAGTALTILPLGRYKANGNGKYLDYNLTEGGRYSDDDTTIKRASGMTKEDGTPVSGTSSKQTIGGTYTQNGLYKAWQEFESVTDTAVSSGAGETKRTPIIILMTDGDPTTGTTSYNSVGTSNIGDGYTPNTYNGYRLTFVAQLTAAWIKGKMEQKYSSDAKFYTLGLGISSSESATAVLYPQSSRETVTGWWSTYLAAADGSNVSLTYNGGNNNQRWNVTRDAAVTAMNYVDRFWSADEADELPNIFDEITAEIEVASKYSVTLVESGDYDLDGYITFADPLGALMEVKSIKGISSGGVVYTGRELAKSMNEGDLGSVENPTDYGDELIRTVKKRIGITDTSVAQQLVGAAYAAGQIGYVDDNNYSNYIGWYGDGSNNYMGFWQESDGVSQDSAPAGAVYANRSYLYLGAEGSSDMMHVIVQVNTEIATGKQSVTFKIPAGLIPTVTYLVEASGDSLEDASKLTRIDAQPIRLLYEVGLQSDINAINLDAKLAEYLAADPENHIHQNPDGTYTFYTNSWGVGDGNGEPVYNEQFAKVMPDSHFNPSYQNERYYHVEDDPIYVKNGSAYELYSRAAAPSGSGYYYRRTVITAATNGGAASVSYVYAPIAESILANPDNLEQTGSTWNVKAGVVHADTERFETRKTTNTTNTLPYSNYPLVSHTGDYNVYAFLGNNGLLTVEPAQGIKLSKTVSQVSTEEGAPTSFTFKVTLDADLAAGSFSVTDADGAALPATVTRNGGKTVVTLTLSDRQTAYITGLPTGTGYTVHEEQTVYYNSSYEHDSVSGTVAKYTVNSVDFVNVPRQESQLAITKKVRHPFEGRPAALNNISFTVEVDLGQQAAGMTFPLAEGGSVTADENGVLTVSVKADATVTVQGILEDTPYEVREVNLPSGFVWNQASSTGLVGEIASTGSTATLVNDYIPGPPDAPEVEISVNKHIEGDYLEDEDFTFNVEMLNKTTGEYELLATKTVTIPWPSHDSGKVSIGDIVEGFTQLGSNTFHITEANGSTVGMTYSSQIASFRVDVVDRDMDGKLEVEVVGLANTAVTKDDSGYNVGANFTNIYDVDSTYVDVSIKKSLTNNTGIDIPLTGFQFSLYADPACTQLAHITEGEHLTVHAGSKGDVALRIPVTNISQGGAVYYLREVVPASPEPGMSYSDAIYKVTVHATAVENGGDPVLSATADVELYSGTGSVQGGTATFNNTYELQAATATIQGTKTYLRGYDNQSAPMKAGDFSFQLWTTDENREADQLVETVEVNADGTFSFSTLSFTGVGTYQYLVREVPGDKSYITYDTVDHFAMVVVTKGEGGKLEAELRYRKDGAAENTPQAQFTNIYNVSGTASTTIGGSKTLEVLSGVKSLVGNDFTFGLYLDGQQVATARNIPSGSFTFPALTYRASEVGNTYIYTVKEIVPEGAVQNPNGSYTYNGVTYSTASFQVQVQIVDNGDGTVSAQQTLLEAEKIAFTNSYSASPASYTVSGQKNLTGRALSEGEFTFELFETDEAYTVTGSPMETVTNAAGGSFRFTALSYSAVGTHYYVVREHIPAQGTEERLGGVSYDAGLYQIKVQVADNGTGKLTAMVNISRPGSTNKSILFGNKYEAAPAIVDLEATKIYDRLEAEQFSFELEGDINGTAVEQTKTNDAQGLVVFDTLTFDKAGTYEFKVTETDGTSIFPWIFFDKTVYTVKIEVKDNLEGNLVPTVSYTTDKGDADSIVFTNRYILEDEVKVTLEGTKTYENTVTKQPMEMKDGMFEFRLTCPDYQSGYSKTVSNVGGSFTFPELVFTEEDVGTSYTFTVEEIADPNKDYIGYDDAVYTVEIAIGDDLAGGVTVTKTVNGKADTPIAFANTYTPAPATVELEAQKSYDKPMAGGDFSFVLEGDINGTAVEQTKTNDAQGLVDFDTLTFENEGTYTFTVTETYGGKDYIEYDETVYTVTVKVEDNEAGNLVPTVTYATAEGSESSITFTNTYIFVRTASVELKGTKTYENTLTGFYKAIGEDMFEMQLTGPGVNETVKVKPDGSFAFEKLVYDGDDAGETYTYTVKELDGGKSYIGYDTAEYTVTVVIEDDGLGGVTATKTVQKNGSPVTDIKFANTYTPAPVKVRLEAQKEYTKSLADNKFTFLLDGYIGTAPVSQDKQNDADGKVLFDELTFEREGTYTFTVKEHKGDKQYIEYDETVYTVTVNVTDPGDGQLKADVSYKVGTAPKSSILFKNTYKFITGASVELSGTKTYTNTLTDQPMAISDGMFSFKVSSPDYREGYSETVKNVGGSFTFADLEFGGTDAGKTYTFTVEELPGDKDYIGYDSTKYTVVITVADNGQGGVTVTKTVNGKADTPIAFANTYTPAPATVELEAQKSYDKPMAGGDFSFELEGDINGTAVEQTKTNDAQGKVLFEELTFGNIGQYTLTVTETDGTSIFPWIFFDKTEYTVTVEVKDNKAGNLVPTVTYTTDKGSESSISFTNGYKFITGDSVSIEGVKNFLESTMEGGEFTFHLYQTGEDYAIEGATLIGTATNDAEGSFSFLPDAVEQFNYSVPGTHYYALLEDATDPMDQVLYDENIYNFKVEVTDIGQGAVDAQIICVNATSDTVVFRNVPFGEITEKTVAMAADPTVSVDGKYVKPGEEILYTLRYTNYLGKEAEVTFTDVIPENTTYVDGSAGDGVYDSKTGTLTWTVTAQPEEVITVSFKVTANAPDKVVKNKATVTDGKNTYTTNEVTSHTFEEVVEKAVSLETAPAVSVDGEKVEIGSILVYTIRYNNLTGEKASVTVTDKLPAHTTFVSASDGGVHTDGTVKWTVEVEAWQSVTVTVKVKVDTPEVTLKNKATVLEGENEYTSNEVTTETYEKVTPPTGDSFQMVLLCVLLLASGMGIVILAVTGKKKEAEQ